MFADLYQSAFSKAVKVSPVIDGVTLGPKSVVGKNVPEITIVSASPIESPAATFAIIDAMRPDSDTPTGIRRVPPRKHLPRPRRPLLECPVVELKSESTAMRKAVNAELNKEAQLRVNKKNLERELAAKAEEQRNRQSLQQLLASTRNRALLKPSTLGDTELEDKLLQEDKLAASKAQERSEKIRQNVEEAKRKSALAQETQKLLSTCRQWQLKFVKEYQELKSVVDERDKRVKLPFEDQINIINTNLYVYENICKKERMGSITAEDMIEGDELLRKIVKVSEGMRKEIVRLKEVDLQEKIAKEAEEEKKVKEEEERQKQKKESETSSEFSDCFDMASFTRFTALRKLLTENQTSLAAFINDESLKKFRFELQKAVTTPINAISPINGAHMRDKYQKLHNLLAGKQVPGLPLQASQHPLALMFCKEITAKRFVKQGDQTVSSKPDSAFAFASIVVNLWADFPDFGEVLLAHFQEECPYLAPVFLPQVEGQTDQDFYKSLGYKIIDGEIEKHDKFLKRMKGIMRLYAAIIITQPRDCKAHPLSLAEAWRWLAAVLNLPPKPDICAELILELLQVAGHDLWLAYGGQFTKLLAYICQEYFPRLEKITQASCGGPLTRLEIFLQTVMKDKKIELPAGVIPPNFW